MSLSIENDSVVAQVVKKRPLSTTEAGKNVRDFLRLGHVADQLSAEDYARLMSLQEVLLQQGETKKKRKHKATNSSETEPDSVEPADIAEPDKKKRRRRRCIT